MAYNTKFGPGAQTSEQRAWVLEQMKRMIPRLQRTTAYTQQIYARYVAGELSWVEVHQARELAASGG